MAVQLLKKPSLKNTKKFYGPFASLTIAAFFSWLAFVIGKYTGLSATIWALILGAAMGSTGLVPPKILDHAKSSGIFNVGVFAVIIPSLAKIKVSDLLVLSFNTIMVFIVVFAVHFPVLLYSAAVENPGQQKPGYGRSRNAAFGLPSNLSGSKRNCYRYRRNGRGKAGCQRRNYAEISCRRFCYRYYLLGNYCRYFREIPVSW